MTNNSVSRPEYEKYRGLRALLLTRVSSPDQSHDAQERVIREKLIKHLGLQLDEERHVIHDTYTGLEYRYRTALDEILSMAEHREFDLLCLDVLDRGLGRKGVSREVFRGQLRELGIHILTTEPSDHSDDDSLEGQLMRLLKGYKAEEEINDFVRRSTNAKRHKASGDLERGIPPKVIGGGTRLYGYKYVVNTKGKREMLEPNYDVIMMDRKDVAWTEVRVVQFMFRCAKRRIAMRQIAKRLNAIGIPSPSISKGVAYKSKGIQAEKPIWQAAVISRMLRHTGYSGEEVMFAVRSIKVPGKAWERYEPTPPEEQIIVPIPALVNKDLQNEVLNHLSANQKLASRNNELAGQALLRSGFAKCGHCGRNLHVHNRNRPPAKGGIQLGYQCSAKTTSLHPCGGCYILVRILDAAIWQKAIEIIRDPYIIDEKIAQRKQGDPTAARRKQINKNLAKLRNERDSLQGTLLRMMQERILDRNTESVLKNRIKELEGLENQYNSELAADEYIHREWEKAQKELTKLHKKYAQMRERLDDPTYKPSNATKRELIELLGITVKVWEKEHDPRYTVELNPPDVMLHHS